MTERKMSSQEQSAYNRLSVAQDRIADGTSNPNDIQLLRMFVRSARALLADDPYASAAADAADQAVVRLAGRQTTENAWLARLANDDAVTRDWRLAFLNGTGFGIAISVIAEVIGSWGREPEPLTAGLACVAFGLVLFVAARQHRTTP